MTPINNRSYKRIKRNNKIKEIIKSRNDVHNLLI